MRLKAYTTQVSISCIDAKRIYIDDFIHWDCECGNEIIDEFNITPFIKYGSYCHSYFCPQCEFESDYKMYELVGIGDDCVDVIFNNKHNLKVERSSTMLKIYD